MSLQAISRCVCEFMAGPVAQWVAWHLPRRVVEWAVYRFWAHAMTEGFPNRAPEEITIWQAFDAWDGLRRPEDRSDDYLGAKLRTMPDRPRRPRYDDRSGGL